MTSAVTFETPAWILFGAVTFVLDREAFYAHFAPYVDRGSLDQALAYGAHFAAEVEAAIRQNERVERLVNRQA